MAKTNMKTEKSVTLKERLLKYFADNAIYFVSASSEIGGSFYSLSKLGLFEDHKM